MIEHDKIRNSSMIAYSNSQEGITWLVNIDSRGCLNGCMKIGYKSRSGIGRLNNIGKKFEMTRGSKL